MGTGYHGQLRLIDPLEHRSPGCSHNFGGNIKYYKPSDPFSSPNLTGMAAKDSSTEDETGCCKAYKFWAAGYCKGSSQSVQTGQMEYVLEREILAFTDRRSRQESSDHSGTELLPA